MKTTVKKSLALVALVATLGLSVATPAHADWYGGHRGWGGGYHYGYAGGYYRPWHAGYWHPYAAGYYGGYYGPYAYGTVPVYYPYAAAPAYPILPIGIGVGIHIR